ncbi:MAG: hypothetical protein ACREJU_20105 [Nitrospiraceae bacterium]
MPRAPVTKAVRASKNGQRVGEVDNLLWRLDRLERQVQKLSELVRDHAEDEDRLVKIVAEDREVLRRELLRQHQAKLRMRKRTRADSSQQ